MESDNNPLLAAGFLGDFTVLESPASLPEARPRAAFPQLSGREAFPRTHTTMARGGNLGRTRLRFPSEWQLGGGLRPRSTPSRG